MIVVVNYKSKLYGEAWRFFSRAIHFKTIHFSVYDSITKSCYCRLKLCSLHKEKGRNDTRYNSSVSCRYVHDLLTGLIPGRASCVEFIVTRRNTETIDQDLDDRHHKSITKVL